MSIAEGVVYCTFVSFPPNYSKQLNFPYECQKSIDSVLFIARLFFINGGLHAKSIACINR